MKIIRVLNTNSILTRDKNGEEIVLLGAGIGFKHKPGDSVDESKIEKQFVMKDEAQQTRFKELVNNIPQEYILVAEQIISLAKGLNNTKLNESIHISLADHIHNAIINMQDGIMIPNNLLWDIKRYYTAEYEIAMEGLNIIENELKCRLPEDEAGFIAMHFVNAEYGNENTNVKRIIEFVKEINQLILAELNVTPDENSLNYYRYMTHLKFFAQRVTENIHYKEEDNVILENVLSKYTKEYNCSKHVAKYIQDNYNYKANDDEILYLTVHLAHITNN